ncbi:TIGR02281 family clan AA aspartic protease [Cognatishimia sp. F0-27]|uniref:retropepsin-like aspartic protease family protein n=1 Tax=Cognatishimia sp. F0-27 TaxID=2816855 RepID=UPI001D0C06E6|nr:TIGR02281 family clan AA aspartic protease [Cognatishimia sp. F0-27]MCC1493438.1 TIGR02281 family clan AA aspartic protease [Cognatishimia sp. F0-27]
MQDIPYDSLIYLSLLGGVMVFWVFVQGRERLSTKIKQLAAWGFIFLGVIAGFGLWEDIRRTVLPTQTVFAEEGRIELPRAPDGHYYATLDINGVPTRFVVDTGATAMVLTYDDARRIGLDAEDLVFVGSANTANGLVRTAPVTLSSVAMGPFVERDFRAYVNEGEMRQSLLGMTYLQRFDRLEITGGRLVLER